MRIDLSGMIRSPVPTGVLVSHVGLRRQRENISRDLTGRQGKNDQKCGARAADWQSALHEPAAQPGFKGGNDGVRGDGRGP